MHLIYGLIDPLTHEIRYVGKTNRIKKRFCEHMNDRFPSWKTNWIKSLRDKNLKPEIIVLEELGIDAGKNKWVEAEQFYISYLSFFGARLTNLTNGGEGTHGRVLSPETKEKIASALRGKKRPAEVIAKVSASLMGRKRSPESIAKSAAGLRGTKRSPEFCKMLGDRHRGKKLSPEHLARMSEFMKTFKQSPESIEKRAAKLRGKKRPEWIGRKISEAKILGYKCRPKRKATPDQCARMKEAQRIRRENEKLIKNANTG